MAEKILSRKLWYLNDNVEVVDQDFLRTDARSLVILGEAGMGKTTLLEQLKQYKGYAYCTARKLINSHNATTLLGNNTTLVVDALDEVSAHRDGEAVDLVLQKLDALGKPRFILSCRVADWRSATSIQGIKDLYESDPLELHIEPIDRADAISFLSDKLSEQKAIETIQHLESLGLSGLWSNPQTLELVKKVAQQGKLPTSKGDLFAEATKLLLKEHREEKTKTALAEMAETDVLNAVGASFAALILSGKSGLSRLNNVGDEDLDIRDVAKLPMADRIGELLDSRLFHSKGSELFTYAHRAIGEFLGARWLAINADTSRKHRRLLALFSNQSLVPASLRGIHAWLAWHSPSLAQKTIAADPMGVITYGDADKLTADQAKTLLSSLQDLSKKNPRFSDWQEYRVRGLAQKSLIPEFRSILTRSDTEYRLRLIILQALKGSMLVPEILDVLVSLLLDKKFYYVDRWAAGECLVLLEGKLNWAELVGRLCEQQDEDGSRLALDLMDTLGYEHFTDELLLKVVLAQFERSDRTVGVFDSLVRNLSPARLDPLIEGVVVSANQRGDRHSRAHNNTYTDLVYGLLARRLDNNPEISPEKLWLLLQPFSGEVGYERKSRESVHNFLRKNTSIRRAVQKYVLFEQVHEKTIWMRAWRLHERSSGLGLTEDDIVSHLEPLDSNDAKWREIVELTRLSQNSWTKVRDAAARFIEGRPEEQAWFNNFSNPPPQDWQIKEQKRERADKEKREKAWAKHRKEFLENIEKMRTGAYGWIVNPAKAYLNLFNDMNHESSNGSDRLSAWLGDDLRDAALQGFESFLTTQPPHPTATQISEGYANEKRWEASYIIVAALIERHLTGRGFDDLSDERLMAGLFEIRHSRIDDHAGVATLDNVLAEELRNRAVWETTKRLYFEPQFERQRSNIHDLYGLMRDDRDSALATTLAIDWITRYSEIAEYPEAELIDKLLCSSSGQATLRELLPKRLNLSGATDERRLNWNAVGLIVDFDKTVEYLKTHAVLERNLFWHVRARSGDDTHRASAIRLKSNQLAWLIRNFRGQFPCVGRPSGMTSGNTNDWDATEFILALINRLAEDISPEAVKALNDIKDETDDGYTEHLKTVSAQQARKKFEADWKAPDLKTIYSAISDSPPTNAAQLHAIVAEELKQIQRKIIGSDVDWYRDFLKDGEPRVEDECRDTILKMLRPLPFQIQAAPEGHLADDKRCDIVCTYNDLLVPIEIKGQWHSELWKAADHQLDRLYVNDWRAERGIYLVLWFGRDVKKALTKPPGDLPIPQSPMELESALKARFFTTRDGRTEVIALDMTRPK